jgi:predicted HTH domain antitoxin
MDTIQVSLELPRAALTALRQDADGFVREMRLAAAVKWYETQTLSQGKAAEVAGLSRSEFLVALSRYGVSAFQYSADEVIREAGLD